MEKLSMFFWIAEVQKPIADFLEGSKILILDEAQAHLTRKVHIQIAFTHTELEVIRGGYTLKLQVMDVGLNKPFKHRIWGNVEFFMMENDHSAKPCQFDVSNWIAKSWNAVNSDCIQKTQHRIGYTMHGFDCTVLADSDSDSDSKSDKEDPFALAKGEVAKGKERRVAFSSTTSNN